MLDNHLLKIVFLVVIFSSNVAVAATDIVNAKIVDVSPDKDYGIVYVKFDKSQNGETSCTYAGYETTYQINDLGTSISDALLSTALTALATGKSVKAVGAGVCNGRAGIESLRLITFEF